MKVLMLFPAWTGVYGGLIRYFARRSSTWPPLNLALLAGIAEKHGHEVEIIDGEVEGFSNEELVKRALSRKPDLIAMTATSPFFHINKTVAELVKQQAPGIPVAIGGPHITIMKEKAFAPAFDFAFVSEAEESWPQLLEQYEAGKDVSGIKGLIYREHGQVKILMKSIHFQSPQGICFQWSNINWARWKAEKILPQYKQCGDVHGNVFSAHQRHSRLLR